MKQALRKKLKKTIKQSIIGAFLFTLLVGIVFIGEAFYINFSKYPSFDDYIKYREKLKISNDDDYILRKKLQFIAYLDGRRKTEWRGMDPDIIQASMDTFSKKFGIDMSDIKPEDIDNIDGQIRWNIGVYKNFCVNGQR